MPRSSRQQFENAIYHIMNRGLARENIVFGEKDHAFFLQGLEEIHRLYGVEIYAYCLMSNHFHILAKTPKANISRGMRHLSHCLAQRVNKRMGRDGPVFKGRFKSILVASKSYLGNLIRYIHANPVDAKIVQNPLDYRWSSAKLYFSQIPPKWLKAAEAIEFIGGSREAAVALTLDDPRLKIFYNRDRLGDCLDENSLDRARDTAIHLNKVLPGS